VTKTRIEAYQGDITECEADAIVNAANNHLWMGSGVAGAIKRKGGKEIEDEAVSKGPIPVGEAVVTKAGGLKARVVIHAAGMGQDLVPTEVSIRNSTLNALRRASELGLESIAFPLIGSGVGGFPVDEVARIMLGAVTEFMGKETSVKDVRFAAFTTDDYSKVKEILGENETG
jgi:O-acetyl-ADP-ribose deacetylase (regulator of RNase III)